LHPRPDPIPLIPDDVTHLLLANEIPVESTVSYLKVAHSQSVTTIFNPSPMLSAEALRAFPFNQLEWLIVNQGEMATIYESLVGKMDSISDSEESPDKVIENALQLYKKLECRTSILCTLGSQGVIYVRSLSKSSRGTDADTNIDNSEAGHLPAAKLLNPIKDTTGAGDCFMGFFAAGMARLAESDSGSKSDVSKEVFTDVLKTCLVVSLPVA
jgi:ribokinase